MVQKGLGLLFLFLIVPSCTGMLTARFTGGGKKSPACVYLAGFLTMLAVFQLIAVPVMILEPRGMRILVPLYGIVCAILSAAGILILFRDGLSSRRKGKRIFGKASLSALKGGLSSLSLECRIYWLLAFAAIAFQMYMSYTCAVFDGDDSYYVVQSVIADQTDILYRIRPYTGLSTDLDIRHALATLPLFIAYAARLTGIHAAIAAHTLLPLVLIPLTYLCYFQIGKRLLGKANVRLPIFMTLVCILQIWGNTSIYTNATFFLMRTWQGKSIMANLVLLVQIWLLLEILDTKKNGSRKGYWALLVITNVTAAMMTSMGAFLAAMFIGIVGLVAALRLRRPSLLLKLMLCCIPNVIYLVMLLVMG